MSSYPRLPRQLPPDRTVIRKVVIGRISRKLRRRDLDPPVHDLPRATPQTPNLQLSRANLVPARPEMQVGPTFADFCVSRGSRRLSRGGTGSSATFDRPLADSSGHAVLRREPSFLVKGRCVAETCTQAFGRYLRILRERKGLSLDEVSSLSRTFPDQINKGYLSRCENGHQKLAFPKAIPLSRIYEVPGDVLIERMELDMELDRVGGPETEGLAYADLVDQGRQALVRGHCWAAYGYLRDAVVRAPLDPVQEAYRDRMEQVAASHMNCATPALKLGRMSFALHEFRLVNGSGRLSPKLQSIALERMSTGLLAQNRFREAEDFVDRGLELTRAIEDDEFLAYQFGAKARCLALSGRYDIAVGYFQRTHELLVKDKRLQEAARCLNSICECYLNLKRYRAARMSALAADKLTAIHGGERTHAISLLALGLVDAAEEKYDAAVQRWRESSQIARRLNDRELRFRAEFELYKDARREGNAPISRAIERRLYRLSPWLPSQMDELLEFRRLTA